MVPFLSLLSCEPPVPVKKHPDRKKKEVTKLKRTNRLNKTRQMFSMPGNFKVTLLQAYTKNNYFLGQQTKKLYKTFHNVNCACTYVIYLMECILCNKQYVGKAETSFNIRLNNYRKDVKKTNAIMACKHLQQESHNFDKHAKFTIIDQ